MPKTKRGQDEPTVIKKYANRRLYDTGRSSYVTLEDLRQMMHEGYDFVVYDAKTGEDITRGVLAQIIAEKESTEGDNLLPTGFMRKLIGMYGDNMQGMVPNYLESTMDLFVKNQERMREQINKSLEGMTNMKGVFQTPPALEELNRKNMAMFENAMKMFAPFGMGAMTGGKGSADKEQKIRELKQNIAEMQKELNRIAAE